MWEPGTYRIHLQKQATVFSMARSWKQLEALKDNKQDVSPTTNPFKVKSRDWETQNKRCFKKIPGPAQCRQTSGSSSAAGHATHQLKDDNVTQLGLPVSLWAVFKFVSVTEAAASPPGNALSHIFIQPNVSSQSGNKALGNASVPPHDTTHDLCGCSALCFLYHP